MINRQTIFAVVFALGLTTLLVFNIIHMYRHQFEWHSFSGGALTSVFWIIWLGNRKQKKYRR